MESGVFYHAGCKRFPMKHRWIFQPVMKPRQCAILSAPLLLILWLPALIAGFPGFFSYDAGLGYLMQWQQVTDGVLNAHHPILHTLFLKYTILFGKSLFGTFNAVVLLSVMFQAIIFAICIKCLLDFGMPRFYFLFMIVFWA